MNSRSNSGITESGHETMRCRKVGNSGSMQRKRRTQKGGNTAFGQSIVAEPNCLQLERNLA